MGICKWPTKSFEREFIVSMYIRKLFTNIHADYVSIRYGSEVSREVKTYRFL